MHQEIKRNYVQLAWSWNENTISNTKMMTSSLKEMQRASGPISKLARELSTGADYKIAYGPKQKEINKNEITVWKDKYGHQLIFNQGMDESIYRLLSSGRFPNSVGISPVNLFK